MYKARFSPTQKSWLRTEIVFALKRLFLTDAEAIETATRGNPSLVDWIARRVAQRPSYIATHRFFVEEVARAFGEWIAHKTGVKIDDASLTETFDFAEQKAKETQERAEDAANK